MIDLLATFVFFFAVIDPIGTIPVFIAVTQQYDSRSKRKIAIKATITSAAILIFFVVAGEYILKAIAVPLTAFQIAGGIVLFLFAMTMIFGQGKPEEEIKLVKNRTETAIFPLAVPSIAGPGAMLAAVLMTENSRYSVIEQLQTAGVIVSVLLVCLIFMLAASSIHRFIGHGGASIISRVMGLILASVATSNVLGGIKQYFAL